MLFVGLIDAIRSMEQNLAELIVIAENATHLSAPLNFLTRLTKLADAKDVPYVYACQREALGRACSISTGISVISIKIGPSYFAKKIADIKGAIVSVADVSVKASVSS